MSVNISQTDVINWTPQETPKTHTMSFQQPQWLFLLATLPLWVWFYLWLLRRRQRELWFCARRMSCTEDQVTDTLRRRNNHR